MKRAEYKPDGGVSGSRRDHILPDGDLLTISPVPGPKLRARRLALSLLELGEDIEGAERQLHRWRFHPLVAREATAWAWKRHSEANAAANAWTPDDAA